MAKKRKKKKGKWIQAATKRMKRKGTTGSFRAWCARRGLGNKVTLLCIQKGLRSKSPAIRKKANFARNVRK